MSTPDDSAVSAALAVEETKSQKSEESIVLTTPEESLESSRSSRNAKVLMSAKQDSKSTSRSMPSLKDLMKADYALKSDNTS